MNEKSKGFFIARTRWSWWVHEVYAWFMASPFLYPGRPGRVAFDRVRLRPNTPNRGIAWPGVAKGRRRLVDRRGVPLEARGGCAASSEGRSPFGGGKAPPPEARKSTPRRPFSPSVIGEDCSKRRAPTSVCTLHPPLERLVWGIRVARLRCIWRGMRSWCTREGRIPRDDLESTFIFSCAGDVVWVLMDARDPIFRILRVLLTLAKTGISRKRKKKKRKFTIMISLRFSIVKFVSSSRQVEALTRGNKFRRLISIKIL